MRNRAPENAGFPEDMPGSLSSSEPGFLVVGKLRRPHGLVGEMLMEILTTFPERLRPGKQVYIGEDHQPIKIVSVRHHAKGLILRFSDLDHVNKVAFLRNTLVFVRVNELPKLAEGEYYHHELIGLEVVSESGEQLGVLAEILVTGANDVYVVRTAENKEILIPAVESIVLGVDIEKRVIRVKLQEWI